MSGGTAPFILNPGPNYVTTFIWSGSTDWKHEGSFNGRSSAVTSLAKQKGS